MSAHAVTATTAVLEKRAVIPDHVVVRQFAEETVVLNLKTGYYHGLNVTGGRMFDVLAASESVGAAVRQLAAEYEQSVALIEEDLTAFCRALLDRELLELHARS